jgi:hypothetical protein
MDGTFKSRVPAYVWKRTRHYVVVDLEVLGTGAKFENALCIISSLTGQSQRMIDNIPKSFDLPEVSNSNPTSF